MSFTSKQISNFINDRISFRFAINSNYIINFNSLETIFTFNELEKVAKSNLDYWKTIPEEISSHCYSSWQNLNNKINATKEYLSEITELNEDTINNYLYNNLSSNRQTIDQKKVVYTLSIDSTIDKDLEIRKIKSFITFYLQQTNENLPEAIKYFVYLFKNINYLGNYFASSTKSQHYPALYLLRKQFSNIKENLSDFETNIVSPIATKLKKISDESDEQYEEITSFIEDKYDDIKQKFDKQVLELNQFQDSINHWQNEKQEAFNTLEETYKNKLSLEAPEQLWNERSTEYQKQAKNWTCFLIFTVIALLFTSARLVIVIHNYSMDIIKEIPFISESFILISVISFFIYIVRILIKIVMSNHHLSMEYKQKAALTRFYQSLIYSGSDIEKEERLIIINSLFSRIDTGLVKTDNSNDNDVILSILNKNIKS